MRGCENACRLVGWSVGQVFRNFSAKTKNVILEKNRGHRLLSVASIIDVNSINLFMHYRHFLL